MRYFLPCGKLLSGKEKVIYQMKGLGFRVQRFTSESNVVATLTVKEGLIKNRVKGGEGYINYFLLNEGRVYSMHALLYK